MNATLCISIVYTLYHRIDHPLLSLFPAPLSSLSEQFLRALLCSRCSRCRRYESWKSIPSSALRFVYCRRRTSRTSSAIPSSVVSTPGLGSNSHASEHPSPAVASYLAAEAAHYVAYPEYWQDPGRPDAYYLPPAAHPIWSHIRQVVPKSQGGIIRILKSKSTPGYCVYLVDPTGVARVTDWTYLPDLLLWNFVKYFAVHPLVNEVWCETVDTDDYANSSAASDPSGLYTVGSNSQRSSRSSSSDASDSSESPNYAIVIRRSELSYQSSIFIASLQRDFFRDHHIGVAAVGDFVSTLHGR